MRAACLLALCGCASVGPTAFFRSATANPEHDNAVMRDYADHRSTPVFRDVTVIESDDQSKLEVIDGSVTRFRNADVEVLGTFELKPDHHSPFAFTDYSSMSRKGLCWPQVPLTWMTAGVWLAVPTSYFCWARTPGTRDTWVTWVKQLVDSAGGDLAVVTFTGSADKVELVKGYVVKTH